MSQAPKSSSSSLLTDFWKDDFVPLQSAGQAVTRALREDESAPDADLYRRLSASSESSHLYFKASSSSQNQQQQPSSEFRHLRSVPLPQLLSQQLATVKSHCFMGLLAPASLAWMSVDDKVFLWSFASTTSTSSASSLCCFQVPSGQNIVAVGLIRPKKGTYAC
jgi:nuclear pore complex protein Nup155